MKAFGKTLTRKGICPKSELFAMVTRKAHFATLSEASEGSFHDMVYFSTDFVFLTGAGGL